MQSCKYFNTFILSINSFHFLPKPCTNNLVSNLSFLSFFPSHAQRRSFLLPTLSFRFTRSQSEMETVKTSRFITEVAPAKFMSATREPFKNMLTTISEEDFDFDELVRATADRLSSSCPGSSSWSLAHYAKINRVSSS